MNQGRPFASVSAAAALLALAAPAAAQSMSDKAVESEIAFARGLARDWAFVDMAQSVLDDVADADLSENMANELGLVRCEVFTNAAKATRDVAKRGELLRQAISSYEDYIRANPYAETLQEAESSLIELAVTFARNADIALRDAAGEEAEQIKTDKSEVLESASNRMTALKEKLEEVEEKDRTLAQNIERLSLMLQMGDIYRMRGEVYDDPGSGVTFFEAAVDIYSEILFDNAAGEGTEFGLRANAGIGQVMEAMGDIETAREYYGGVIESVIPPDPQDREDLLGWSELEMGIKQKRFLYTELTLPGTQRTSRALGDLARGLHFAMYFYNLYRQEGFQLSSLGYGALLEIAETMLAAGGYVGGDANDGDAKWYPDEQALVEAKVPRRQRQTAVDFALDLARQVASEASGSREAVQAGLLLDKINERPGIELPPEQMYQAAIAQYRTGEDFGAALESYYGLLARLDTMDQADRIEFGGKTYNGIGNALYQQGRYFESALAFREALLNYRDPEWDSSNAQRYRSAIVKYRNESGTSGVKAVEDLVAEAEDMVIRYGEDQPVDVIKFGQAEKELSRGNYAAAIEKYESITENEGMYEPARVRIGEALMLDRKFGEARAKFDEFINGRAKDPNWEPQTPITTERRHQSLARAIYQAAFIDNLSAGNRYKKSDGSDASGYESVITRLEGYAGQYQDVGDFAKKAQAMLATAYARTGKADEAGQVLADMRQRYKGAPEIADAAVDLYRSYKGVRDRLVEANGDADAITTATRNMADSLSVANQITARPKYNNLRTEASLWQELGEFENAIAPLSKLLQRFKDDEEYGERIVKYVVPDLAEALIETDDVSGAKELLSPYTVGENAPLTTRTPTVLMARAMMGSVTNDGQNVVAKPGAGGSDEEFAAITQRLDALEDTGEKWTCEWYEAKFASIYGYYVWGQQDQRRLATAKKSIDDLVNLMGGDAQFTPVDESCADAETPAAAKRRLGGGKLAARFRWLYQRTR